MGREALVIARSRLVETGFIPAKDIEGRAFYARIKGLGDLKRLLDVVHTSGEYGDASVETNPSLQQVIMYGYVQRGDGRFLLYQRAGGENYKEHRLAGKVSIGIGGHMEPTDLSLAKSFYRELDEEAEVLVNGTPLNFRDPDGNLNIRLMKKHLHIRPVGFIKDERDEAGKVHFGVACKILPRAENVDIRVRTEPGQENITSQYVSLQEFIAMQAAGQIQPEGWTDIVFREEIVRNSQEKSI